MTKAEKRKAGAHARRIAKIDVQCARRWNTVTMEYDCAKSAMRKWAKPNRSTSDLLMTYRHGDHASEAEYAAYNAASAAWANAGRKGPYPEIVDFSEAEKQAEQKYIERERLYWRRLAATCPPRIRRLIREGKL